MKIYHEVRNGQIVPVSAEIENEKEVEFLLEQLRPKGKWGPCYENPRARNGKYYRDCSNCGEPTLTGNNNFCPHCGADMRGTEDTDPVIKAIQENNAKYDERPNINFSRISYDLDGDTK